MQWRSDDPDRPETETEMSDGLDGEEVDLTCPSCSNDLMADDRFLAYRVCGGCGRHFSIGARERVSLLVDAGVFQELDTPAELPSSDHERLPPAERLAEYQHQQVIGEAVVTGFGSIGGCYTAIVALDDHLVSHSLGAILSGKVIAAFEYARREKLPLVLLAAGGTQKVPAGPLSLAQGSRLATAAAQLHLDGVVMIGVLTQPMSTGVFATLVSHCDVLYSEPHVSLHEGGGGLDARETDTSAASLLAGGWIDGIIERPHLAAEIGRCVETVTAVGIARPAVDGSRISDVRATGDRPMENARPVAAPGIDECLRLLVPDAMHVRGDRVRGDNPAAICGIGRLDTVSVAFAGLVRPDGPIEPEAAAIAARKITRLARLASRLELPLVILADGGESEAQVPFSVELAYAGSSLASTLALLPVPVVSVGSGHITGALATLMMNADRQYLMSGAVVFPPPEPATGWQPGRPAGSRTGVDAISAVDCLRLGLIDGVIPAPDQRDAAAWAAAIRREVLQALAELGGTGQRRLLDTRVLRQRALGQSTPDGLAEARSELWALQEWQRSVERNVERSLGEWRGRWENLKANQPKLNFQRPDMGDLAARMRARRSELLERAGRGDRPAPD